MSAWLRKLRKRFKKGKVSIQERYPHYKIGKATYGNPDVRSWNEGATLEIGSFCSIAAGVTIMLGGEHRHDWVSTFPFPVLWKNAAGHVKGHPRSRGDVVIGSDVWIGTEAMILSGVHIGHGAVVGARSIVTRDVPPYAIVAGNPARIVRFRFEPSIVQRLLNLAWWEWDDTTIVKYLPSILQENIELFLDDAEG